MGSASTGLRSTWGLDVRCPKVAHVRYNVYNLEEKSVEVNRVLSELVNPTTQIHSGPRTEPPTQPPSATCRLHASHDAPSNAQIGYRHLHGIGNRKNPGYQWFNSINGSDDVWNTCPPRSTYKGGKRKEERGRMYKPILVRSMNGSDEKHLLFTVVVGGERGRRRKGGREV